MASTLLLTLVLLCIAVHGVHAKATIVGFEETLEEILEELKEEVKRDELENELEAAKEKRIVPGARNLNVNETTRIAFDYAYNIVQHDEELKKFYYYRGNNIVAFSTDHSQATELLSSHGYDLQNREYIIFEVRACNDTLVTLFHSNGDTYTIHIYDAVNSKTDLLKNSVLVTTNTTQFPLLNCSSYKRFLVSWSDKHVQVLHDHEDGQLGWSQVIDWQDSTAQLQIVDIEFGTAGNVEGHWRTVYRGNELLVLSSDQPVFELLQNLTANFPVVQEPYMVFKVQSCSTARLGLKEDAENDGKLWEITFDMESPAEVLVRRNVGAGIKSRGGIIVDNCKDNLTFFVSWRNSLVQVFQQHGGRWLTVLEWFDAKGRDVSFVGVSGVATWTVYDDHETGIDLPAGSTTSETMSGLNDIEHNLTELEEEEHRANLALYALQYLLDTGFEGAKTVEDLKAIPGFLEAFRQEQVNRDRKACNEKNIKCRDFKKSPWRSMDGTCNNLIHEGRGSTGTPQVRLVAADYADGVTEFKKLGKNGQTLPSAREVSAFVLSEGNSASPPDDPNRTIMMAVMGQFYDHDITETPLTKGYRETTIGCCDIIDEQVRNERIQCKTIEIPANDPFFNHTCMAFKRSLPSRGEDKCEPTVREQINDITAFVDGSMVYGSSEEVAESLRTFSDGKLLVAQDNLLPLNDPSGCILDDADNSHCFLAGDVRVNENANLMVIHTAFVRYHNILCDQLIENNLTDDERIYQIARKIIGGILQNILFGHWLPHVIGEDMMIKSGLAVGSSFVYDETVNPSVTLAFSTAALRYGHTLVQGTIKAVHESLKYTNDTALKDTFFRPGIVFSSAADIARSFHTIQGSAVDSALPDDLKDHLFETDTAHGLDLSALNIQRGRDHGLPGYVAYREWAGLSVPTNFDELEHHTTDFQQSLGAMYGDVRDIDLFAGGMTETVITDTHLGPTFTAIFVDQFKRLKFGDRYYFENTDSETGFSEGQIDAIKKVTLGKVMCQAFNFDVMQKDVFDVPSIEDFKQCSEYDELDMRLFTDIGDEE